MPDPEDLQRLTEECLEPARAAEIEAHLKNCPPCQDQLETLTAGRARDEDDPTAHEATGWYGGVAEPSMTADLGGTAELGRAAGDPAADLKPPGNTEEGVTADFHAGQRLGSTEREATGSSPADPERTVSQSGARPDGLDGRPRARDRSPWPTIPGYELREKLGEGGMGVVFLARQIGLNREVAIKMIRGGSQARPEHFARFRVEAEAVARLRHPHILQIYDIGESDGLPYVSLELLEGGSLDERLGGTPQPGRQAAELMSILCTAVQVAHDAGIVHRDLKPSNVLFTRDGIPKVTDFGLAKRLESDSRQTESGAIMGSPSYMAPEQARGHTKDVGPAADVYALGAILYEMLTGRPPFMGETPLETVRQVVDDDAVPPSRLVPRVARDLETICLKCLDKEPSKRYATARALAEDLQRYRDGESILARRTPLPERAYKWARRRPAQAALYVLGFALFVLATLGIAFYERTRRLNEVAQARHAQDLERTGSRLIETARETTSREPPSQDELNQVEVELASFLTHLENQPEMGDLPIRVKTAKDQVDRTRRELATREDRRKRAVAQRQRFQTFLGLRTQAHLNAAEYELESGAHPARFRDSVRQALAVYARDPQAAEADWALSAPLPEILTPVEQATVAEGCYDLLLLLARTADPAAGLKVLERAARLRPEPTAAYHHGRAECLARLGDVAGQKHEEELASRRPAVTALDHFLIGREQLTRRRWEEAIGSLETALGLDPNLTAAHLLLAVANYQSQPQRLGEALSSINSGLRSHPDLVGLYLLRALILGARGNQLARIAAERRAEAAAPGRRAFDAFEAAEKDYRTALDRQPSDDVRYVLLVNRAGMFLQAGRPAESLADLEAAIRLEPGPYQAYATLAQWHQRRGRREDASRAFARAIERAPDPAVRVALHRSRALLHAGRRDVTPEERAAALHDLDEAIRLAPGDRAQRANDHVERARLFFGGGRPDASLEACAAAIKLVPDHAGAHQLRISALMALKRFDELLGSCDAYLSREKPNVEVLELRGLARVARQDLSGAIADYTRAIELESDLEPAIKTRLLNRRGWAYHLADATRLALDDFEVSLKLVQDQGDAHAGRGLARVRLGDWKKAVADADAAVRLVATPPVDKGATAPWVQARFNAARIYAQAIELAAAEVDRHGERAVSLYRAYRSRALDLLQQALQGLSAADRVKLLSDPALQPLRLGRTMGVTQQTSD